MIIGAVITVAWDTGGTGFTDDVGRQWVRCDGRDLSQTTYPALYTIVGDRYSDGAVGAGDFRIPDMRGTFLRGTDAAGTVDADAPARTIDGPGNPSSDTGTLQNKALETHYHGSTPLQPIMQRAERQPNGSPMGNNASYNRNYPNYPSLSLVEPTSMVMSSGTTLESDISWVETSPAPTATFAPPNLVMDYILRIA